MTTHIDRRRFLTYTGAAGAATGALWVAPSVLGSSSAFAQSSNSSCAYAGTLQWASASWASGGTGNDSWVSGDLSGGIPVAPDNSSNNASKSFVAQVGGTGNSSVYVKVTVTAVGPPATNTGGGGFTGGPTNNGYGGAGTNEYVLASSTASSNPATTSGGYEIEFSFFSDSTLSTAATVSNISFGIYDIDGTASTYYEQVWITGASGLARSDSNTNIVGAGTSSSDAWRNGTANSNLLPPTGDIAVAIPSASTFTFRDQAVGSGANLNHAWAIGQLSWGC